MSPSIGISTSSGMLRVTIRPGRTWPFLLLEIGGLIIFAALAYQSWARMSQEFRSVFILAVLAGAVGLMFQLSGIEIMEVNASKIMLTKDIHGWERKREYEIKRMPRARMDRGHRR